MPLPKHPCKFCSSFTHWPYQCFKNPKKPKPKKYGKHYAMWRKVRRAALDSKAEAALPCYICSRYVRVGEATLDHVKPRGSHPELRYELSNLQICCVECNSEKGSKSLEAYIRWRDHLGLYTSRYARMLVDLDAT